MEDKDYIHDKYENQKIDENLKREAYYRNQAKDLKDKDRKKSLLFLLLLLLIFIFIGVGFLFVTSNETKSKFELDREALEGFLPGKSAKEIQDELNRIVDESMFNVSINPNPYVVDSVIDVHIQNIPNNHYWMQVNVYYQPDRDSSQEELLYSSKVIKNGHYLIEGSATHQPPLGSYNGRAVFTALFPDTFEEIGKTVANIIITSSDIRPDHGEVDDE